eukprot:Pompholyxophrys_punicea_v1_NODE_274_length_2425_cov_15.995782.p1 type:complete len:459 gc:universal NODE_274_length_2425_cov_15.995782:2371-995(-)
MDELESISQTDVSKSADKKIKARIRKENWNRRRAEKLATLETSHRQLLEENNLLKDRNRYLEYLSLNSNALVEQNANLFLNYNTLLSQNMSLFSQHQHLIQEFTAYKETCQTLTEQLNEQRQQAERLKSLRLPKQIVDENSGDSFEEDEEDNSLETSCTKPFEKRLSWQEKQRNARREAAAIRHEETKEEALLFRDSLTHEIRKEASAADKKRLVLAVYYHERSTGKLINHSLESAANFFHINSETVRNWRDRFEEDGELPELRGKHVKIPWLLKEESDQEQARQFIRENANVSGQKNMTSAVFAEFLNKVLLKDHPHLPKKGLSHRTALNYIHRLGFTTVVIGKNTFVDGHGREDVKFFYLLWRSWIKEAVFIIMAFFWMKSQTITVSTLKFAILMEFLVETFILTLILLKIEKPFTSIRTKQQAKLAQFRKLCFQKKDVQCQLERMKVDLICFQVL